MPNHPGQPGNRALAGLGAAALGTKVYKYGATTEHTVGLVTNINFNFGNVANAMPGGFLGGLAYDITSQIVPFSTVAALA